MNRDFLYTVIVLLVAVKWHHNTDVSEAAALQDSTVFVCNLLGEKLDEKDDYISQLEVGIMAQYERIQDLKETVAVQEKALSLFIDEPVIEIEE